MPVKFHSNQYPIHPENAVRLFVMCYLIGIGCNYSEDISTANLRGADLSGVYIESANLGEANLQYANMYGHAGKVESIENAWRGWFKTRRNMGF